MCANAKTNAKTATTANTNDCIWSYLLHLSYNMWADHEIPNPRTPHIVARDELRFDMELFHALLPEMVAAGINQVIIDVGDAVRFDSHPEIAVKGAWTPAVLKRELARMRAMGLEPIPKLNFSACHDVWLKHYARMVSTDMYYRVCAELIAETLDLFDRPRFFHLGMDEETMQHQRQQEYVVIRQFGLWWRDLRRLTDAVEQGGARPWVWSDYVWNHPEDFYANMPRSVLQSNWYYGRSFSRKLTFVQTYLDLDREGFDQVPTGSNWSHDGNFISTVRFCARALAPERLLGFMQAPWHPTLSDCAVHHRAAIAQVAQARKAYRRMAQEINLELRKSGIQKESQSLPS